MGSLFRSEPMAMCQLFLQSEAAYQCINELGELGLVQFLDLNADSNAFTKKFVNDVRRCDEMQRKLRFIEKEVLLEDIQMAPEDEGVETPLPKDMIDMEAMFEKIEDEIRQVNENVNQMNTNYVKLLELQQVLKCVDEFFCARQDIERSIEATDLSDQTSPPEPQKFGDSVHLSTDESDIGPPKTDNDSLGFIAGVIGAARFENFERMLWRVGRGIIFCHRMFIYAPIVDVHGEEERKCAFILFFPGEQLKARVKKICEAFRANVYPCPASGQERAEACTGVLSRLEDMRQVFNGSQDHRMKLLVNAAKNLRNWLVQVSKMKAVFHVLNMLNIDVTQKCFIAECWAPENDMSKIQAALRRGTEAAGSSFPCIINRVDSNESPPTFNRTNKYTSGFQTLVDAYGVAVYREVSPTPYAIITFPFLFAVMFGDIGHGLLMTLFAIALIVYEKKLEKVRDEITVAFFGGRFIILLMGIFSMYTGLIYNDIFSKSLNLFGTSWLVPRDDSIPMEGITLNPQGSFANESYPFGVDPIWAISDTKIQFSNSYKMKMAVIMGFMQMLFGVLLGLCNHIYFKDRTKLPPPRTVIERTMRRYLNIWGQLIPEVIFLVSLFGYLVFMIVYKWMLPLGDPGSPLGHTPNASCSRSILIMYINMFMMNTVKTPCYQDTFYQGQDTLQMALLAVALLCVPWLLLAKPLYIFYLTKVHQAPLPADFVPIITQEEEMAAEDNRRSAGSDSSERRPSEVSLRTLKEKQTDEVDALGENQTTSIDSDCQEEQCSTDLPLDPLEPPEPLNVDIGEVVINQIIHTIEYCLGAVSNTASYLRLWALSLAHSQLSEVLWGRILKTVLFTGNSEYIQFMTFANAIMLFCGFAAWAFFTVAILLIMEGLSAFLHALRLHWVEFMNKFFKGEGYLFAPFRFSDVLSSMDDA